MEMQNGNDLKVSIYCSAAEQDRRKKSLVNLLSLNAAARSCTLDGEGNVILLPKAAGGGKEQRIISHLGFRVPFILFQNTHERNRQIYGTACCGMIGAIESMKQRLERK